jgi:hypothetical protein
MFVSQFFLDKEKKKAEETYTTLIHILTSVFLSCCLATPFPDATFLFVCFVSFLLCRRDYGVDLCDTPIT